jgi:hypothetical protein
MKKRNKKKNSCAITNLWSSLEKMKKAIFIDLDKQEVTNVLTGNKLTPFLRGRSEKKEGKYYSISYWKNKKVNNLLLHRLFFYWHYGYLPKIVDHKDINRQNNNIENLRELTDSENKRNTNKRKFCRGKLATSHHKGVSWCKRRKKWVAQLRFNKKHIFLGRFDKEDDAGQAYNDAIRKYGLEEVSLMNDTPQERARTLSLFDEPEPILSLK